MAFVETGVSIPSINDQLSRRSGTETQLSTPLASHRSDFSQVVNSETRNAGASDWLTRFQELCSWQKKQQEILLSQQQLQLEKLKGEQQQVYEQLASQRQTRHQSSHTHHTVDSDVSGEEIKRHEQAVEEASNESESDRAVSVVDPGEKMNMTSRRQEESGDEMPVTYSSQVDQKHDTVPDCEEPSLPSGGVLPDDRPVRPAISGGMKNFDDFVEQQLKLDCQGSLNGAPLPLHTKQRSFLRKGQGLQRFGIKGLPIKQDGHTQQKAVELNSEDSTVVEQRMVTSKHALGTSQRLETRAKSNTPDESFMLRTNQRHEVEQKELEEFELMEQLADESSFSSQSSIVRKMMSKGSRQQREDHRVVLKRDLTPTVLQQEIRQMDGVEHPNESQDATLTDDETQEDDTVSSLSDIESVGSDQEHDKGFIAVDRLSSHAIGLEFDDEDTWEELKPQITGSAGPITSTPPVLTIKARQRKVYRPSKQYSCNRHESSDQNDDSAEQQTELEQQGAQFVKSVESSHHSSIDDDDADSTLLTDTVQSGNEPHTLVKRNSEHDSPVSVLDPGLTSPPPTSALVSKLFPSLGGNRAQAQQKHVLQQSPMRTAKPVAVVREGGLMTTDEVSAATVKQKLVELETEIERFKRENLAVAKLKDEREKALHELQQAKTEFDRRKSEETSQFEAYKEEELKKIRREKRVFEQYRMTVQNEPNRQEREEISVLKKENLELRDELERRESRWAAASERYKGKISALERETTELKQELKVMEEQRLTHWMKQVESKTTDEQQDQTKRAKRKIPTNQAVVRQAAHIKQTDRHEEQTNLTWQSTGVGSKMGKGKLSGQVQKVPGRSPKKAVNVKSENKSVQFRGDVVTSSEEGVQEKMPSDLKSEGKQKDQLVEYPDGRTEVIRADGSKTIHYPNGTKKDVSSDGLSIVLSFFNGDIKKISPNQKVMYYYAETKTQQTTYPDGLEVIEFSNGQVEKHYPDGTKEVIFVDQTVKYLFADGSQESVFTSGVIQRVATNGDVTIEHPNGQREIHTSEFKRREYPDGTVKTVFTDGRQETRYSSGRVRVKDRSGQIVVDNSGSSL